MKYVSTRGEAPVLSFEEAMLTGLARDGGLYVPETIPQMSAEDIRALNGASYEEIAFRVMRPFVGDTFTDEEFKGCIARAYNGFGHAARAPLVQLGPNHFLMELFHGPTLAFKDFAMQLIGQMFEVALKRSGKRVTIVGATSGDTGSAAIEAFRGLEAVDVFILYPHGRVSEVQRRQMTTPDESNVHAIAMDGDFDDCQARLKDMFNDFEFRDGVQLAGVNSINWARVLAQVVYYFSTAVSLGAPERKVSFTVPTGNFGDIFAGFIAKQTSRRRDRASEVPFDEMFDRVSRFTSYTPIQNALGLPGMSVPAGVNDAGLSIGSHFVAPAGREDVLFELAYELEAARPWWGQWAPVSIAGWGQQTPEGGSIIMPPPAGTVGAKHCADATIHLGSPSF